MMTDPYNEAAFEAEIKQYEEDAAEWGRWFDSLSPSEQAKVHRSMDAYVQEVDDERRRQEAWLEKRRAANAERARTKLRKNGQPDRRFKAARPDEYAAAWADGETQEHQRKAET